MPKGILGAPRDAKNQMLFSFKVRQGEEWPSDSSDSDYLPSDDNKGSPIISAPTRKQQCKRKSNDKVNRSGSEEDCISHSKKEKKKKKTRDDGNSLNNKLLETGGERYKDVWGKKIPPEILLKIFRCVTQMEGGALPFLKRAAKTCQLWWEVSQSPVLWDIVDLSYGWVKSTDATLKTICPSRLKCVRDIRLNGWKNLTNTGLQVISENCKDLEAINLSGCRKINSTGIKTLADGCPSLHTVDLSATSTDAVCSQSMKCFLDMVGPRLKSLTVGCNLLKGFSGTLNYIMSSCPNLLCFDASNPSFTADLFSLNIEKFQDGCPKLQILRFANARLRASHASKAIKEESPGFPDLQELSLAIGARSSPINGGVGIDDDFLRRIMKNSHKLKLLDLRSCCSVTNQGLQNLPMTDLQQLFISQSSVARYEGIQVIMQKWQHSMIELDLSWNIYPGASFDIAMRRLAGNPQDSKLQILNLSGTSISYHRVKSILEGCPYLRSLNLQSCRGLPRGMKSHFEGKDLEKLRKDIAKYEESEESTDI